MSAYTLQGGYDTAHVAAAHAGYVEARNRSAVRNLTRFAEDHERGAGWLAEMLDILGLADVAATLKKGDES